jgi:hypothetical protein
MRPSPERHRRNQSLVVEPLESISLTSAISTGGLGGAAHAVISTIPLPVVVALKGSTRSTYAVESPVPDVGATYTLQTSGKLAGLGRANVSGSINSLGFIAYGHARGTMLVAVAGGTLTLELTGPTQRGFSPLPRMLSYVITEGTGKFHNRIGDPVGEGTVDVILKPFHTSGERQGQGTVTLVFHPGIVVLE